MNLKRFFPLIILILAALLLAVLPLTPQPPGLPEDLRIQEGQTEYLRQLELGLLFENQGEFEIARAAFEKASSAEQVEIAALARNGLRRIQAYQQNLLLRIQTRLRETGQSVVENLLPLLLVVVLAYGLWYLFSRPLTRPGYLILPFEDHTSGKLGAGFPSLLNFFIREATHAHVQKQSQLLGLATLEFPLVSTLGEAQDTLADAFASIDSVSLGGIDLPFGKFVTALRQRLSLRQYTLSGAIHLHDNSIRLYAELRESSTQNILLSWQLYSPQGEPDRQVEALAKELAFRFLHQFVATQDSTRNILIESQSWRSLRFFTEGLLLLQSDPTPGLTEALSEARSLFSQAVEVDPGFTTAQYALGIALTRLGQFNQARAAFQEVIERGERFVTEATYNMGLAYYYEFRPWAYEKANECFNEVLAKLAAVGNPGESQKLLQALAYSVLANIAAQYIGEDSEYRPTVRDERQEGESKPLGMAELMQSVQGRYQAAQEIVQALPDGPQTRLVQALLENALGIAYYYAEQPQKARNHLKAATRYYPENPVAYGYIALTLLEDRIGASAYEWLERALEWNPAPQYVEYLYYKFGRFYHKRGELSKACEHYLKAPSLHRAINHAGEVLIELDDPEDAVEMFRKATLAHSKVASYWMNLASSLVLAYPGDSDRLNEAVDAATRAAQLNPKDWQAQDMLGQVYMAQGALEKAQKAFQDSIALNRGVVQNRFHLALVHYQRGNRSKANQEIEGAFATPDRNPTWRQRAAALKQQLIPQSPETPPQEASQAS